MTTPLQQVLMDSRVLLCVGTGGVGKTTVSASLALAAARSGRRVCVITIDPARRLADALGEGSLGHEPHELGEEARQRLGLTSDDASLFACTLDTKRTFDHLVERFAPDDATRRRIFDNQLYQHMADALAGSAEYAAMDRVYEIANEGSYELVIVDTPPARHALDFLDAPQRLAEFLESRLVQGLLHPAFAAGRFGLRIFEGAARRVFSVIERVTGLSFLEDLSEFLIAIESLAVGFRTRAGQLTELLASDEARFLLVTAPAQDRVRSGLRFLEQLEASQVNVAGIIANRVQAWPGTAEQLDALARGDSEGSGLHACTHALEARFGERAEAAARAALDTATGYASQVRSQQQSLAPLRTRAAETGALFQEVPELAGDIHDLEGLVHVERALVGAAERGQDKGADT